MDAKLNFVCHQCLATNRVPQTRIADGPVCAKCKTHLIVDHPIELDDRSFQKYIAQTSVLVIVDFWASWCSPCRSMAPNFKAAAARLSPEIVLAKFDTENNSAANSLNITGIPCLIAFSKGQEIARQAGLMSTDQIVAWAQSVG